MNQRLAWCVPLSKLLGFRRAISKSHSNLPCSHMATLQLPAPVKPTAVWEKVFSFTDTHIYTHTHSHTHLYTLTFASGWFTLLKPTDCMIYLNQWVAPFGVLQTHSNTSVWSVITLRANVRAKYNFFFFSDSKKGTNRWWPLRWTDIGQAKSSIMFFGGFFALETGSMCLHTCICKSINTEYVSSH